MLGQLAMAIYRRLLIDVDTAVWPITAVSSVVLRNLGGRQWSWSLQLQWSCNWSVLLKMADDHIHFLH